MHFSGPEDMLINLVKLVKQKKKVVENILEGIKWDFYLIFMPNNLKGTEYIEENKKI